MYYLKSKNLIDYYVMKYTNKENITLTNNKKWAKLFDNIEAIVICKNNDEEFLIEEGDV